MFSHVRLYVCTCVYVCMCVSVADNVAPDSVTTPKEAESVLATRGGLLFIAKNNSVQRLRYRDSQPTTFWKPENGIVNIHSSLIADGLHFDS